MKITLKTLKGQQLPLEVQPDMTVRLNLTHPCSLVVDLQELNLIFKVCLGRRSEGSDR